MISLVNRSAGDLGFQFSDLSVCFHQNRTLAKNLRMTELRMEWMASAPNRRAMRHSADVLIS